MEFDRKTIRIFSMLGEKGAFFSELTKVASQVDNLAVLTADLGVLSGLSKFKERFPDKFYNVGIAEQNMIGIAAGMAKAGLNVFATTYANFLTMRSFEQIRINLGYMKFPVKIVGSGAGIVMSMSGNSHYSLEDVAIMRAIPNMSIVAPADAFEAVKVLKAALFYMQPLYIRLTGGINLPLVYKKDYSFSIGKAVVLRSLGDILLIAAGSIVSSALEAADILEQQRISVAVINMHTIKPLDTDVLKKYLPMSRLVVTIEEHSCIGGLGGAVAEYKAQYKNMPPQLFIGLPDAFGKAGEYDYLMDKYGLTGTKIAQRILAEIESI